MAPGGVLRRWLLLLLLLWVLAGHAAGPSAPTCAAQYPCLQFSVAETATPDTYDSQAGNGCWTSCLFRVCLTGHFSDASCGLGPSDSLQKVCPVSLSGACPPPSDSSWNSGCETTFRSGDSACTYAYGGSEAYFEVRDSSNCPNSSLEASPGSLRGGSVSCGLVPAISASMCTWRVRLPNCSASTNLSASPNHSPRASPSPHPSGSPSSSPSLRPSPSPVPATIPSRSPSGAPSATPSPSHFYYPTPSPSPHPPLSSNQSPSLSLSPGISPTPSPRLSPTPSYTGQPSASPPGVPKLSPSPSHSESPSDGPSASPSRSPSTSVRASPNPSLSPSPSLSFSPTSSHSPSTSISWSPSLSPFPSPTASPPAHASPSPPLSLSPSPPTSPALLASPATSGRPSASASVSSGLSNTPSGSPSTAPSTSPTLSASQSDRPSPSPSDRPSEGPSASPSHTPPASPPATSPRPPPAPDPDVTVGSPLPSPDPSPSRSALAPSAPSTSPSAIASPDPSAGLSAASSASPLASDSPSPSGSPPASPSPRPSASPPPSLSLSSSDGPPSLVAARSDRPSGSLSPSALQFTSATPGPGPVLSPAPDPSTATSSPGLSASPSATPAVGSVVSAVTIPGADSPQPPSPTPSSPSVPPSAMASLAASLSADPSPSPVVVPDLSPSTSTGPLDSPQGSPSPSLPRPTPSLSLALPSLSLHPAQTSVPLLTYPSLAASTHPNRTATPSPNHSRSPRPRRSPSPSPSPRASPDPRAARNLGLCVTGAGRHLPYAAPPPAAAANCTQQCANRSWCQAASRSADGAACALYVMLPPALSADALAGNLSGLGYATVGLVAEAAAPVVGGGALAPAAVRCRVKGAGQPLAEAALPAPPAAVTWSPAGTRAVIQTRQGLLPSVTVLDLPRFTATTDPALADADAVGYRSLLDLRRRTLTVLQATASPAGINVTNQTVAFRRVGAGPCTARGLQHLTVSVAEEGRCLRLCGAMRECRAYAVDNCTAEARECRLYYAVEPSNHTVAANASEPCFACLRRVDADPSAPAVTLPLEQRCSAVTVDGTVAVVPDAPYALDPTNPAAYAVEDHEVTLAGAVTCNATSAACYAAGAVLFRLPSELAPAAPLRGDLVLAAPAVYIPIQATPDGAVAVLPWPGQGRADLRGRPAALQLAPFTLPGCARQLDGRALALQLSPDGQSLLALTAWDTGSARAARVLLYRLGPRPARLRNWTTPVYWALTAAGGATPTVPTPASLLDGGGEGLALVRTAEDSWDVVRLADGSTASSPVACDATLRAVGPTLVCGQAGSAWVGRLRVEQTADNTNATVVWTQTYLEVLHTSRRPLLFTTPSSGKAAVLCGGPCQLLGADLRTPQRNLTAAGERAMAVAWAPGGAYVALAVRAARGATEVRFVAVGDPAVNASFRWPGSDFLRLSFLSNLPPTALVYGTSTMRLYEFKSGSWGQRLVADSPYPFGYQVSLSPDGVAAVLGAQAVTFLPLTGQLDSFGACASSISPNGSTVTPSYYFAHAANFDACWAPCQALAGCRAVQYDPRGTQCLRFGDAIGDRLPDYVGPDSARNYAARGDGTAGFQCWLKEMPTASPTASHTATATATLTSTGTATVVPTATSTPTPLVRLAVCQGGGDDGGRVSFNASGRCALPLAMGQAAGGAMQDQLLVVRLLSLPAGRLTLALASGCLNRTAGCPKCDGCRFQYTPSDAGREFDVALDPAAAVAVTLLYTPPSEAAAIGRRADSDSEAFVVDVFLVTAISALLSWLLCVAIAAAVLGCAGGLWWRARRAAQRRAATQPWAVNLRLARFAVQLALVGGVWLAVSGALWWLTVCVATDFRLRPSGLLYLSYVMVAAGGLLALGTAVWAFRDPKAFDCAICHERMSAWRFIGTYLPPQGSAEPRKVHTKHVRCMRCGGAVVLDWWDPSPRDRAYHEECWARHCDRAVKDYSYLRRWCDGQADTLIEVELTHMLAALIRGSCSLSVIMLLERHPDLHTRQIQGEGNLTGIHLAARVGHCTTLRCIVEHNRDGPVDPPAGQTGDSSLCIRGLEDGQNDVYIYQPTLLYCSRPVYVGQAHGLYLYFYEPSPKDMQRYARGWCVSPHLGSGTPPTRLLLSNPRREEASGLNSPSLHPSNAPSPAHSPTSKKSLSLSKSWKSVFYSKVKKTISATESEGDGPASGAALQQDPSVSSDPAESVPDVALLTEEDAGLTRVPHTTSLLQEAAASGDEATIQYVIGLHKERYPQCLRWRHYIGDGLWQDYPPEVQAQYREALLQADDLSPEARLARPREGPTVCCLIRTAFQLPGLAGAPARVTSEAALLPDGADVVVFHSAGHLAAAAPSMRALTVLCALGAADFSLWFPPCKHRDALQAADGDHTELLRKFQGILQDRLAEVLNLSAAAAPTLYRAPTVTWPLRGLSFEGLDQATSGICGRLADGLTAGLGDRGPAVQFYPANYRPDVGTLPFCLGLSSNPFGLLFPPSPLLALSLDALMKVQELQRQNSRLSPKHVVPIFVYTYELPGEGVDQIYLQMNKAMRHKDEWAIEYWRPLVWHVEQALLVLPPHSGKLYRGINCRFDSGSYTPGQTVAWTSFSSASSSQAVAEEFAVGKEGSLFFLQSKYARSIDYLSRFPDEREVIFLPNSVFLITSTMFGASDIGQFYSSIDNIAMEQVDPQDVPTGAAAALDCSANVLVQMPRELLKAALAYLSRMPRAYVVSTETYADHPHHLVAKWVLARDAPLAPRSLLGSPQASFSFFGQYGLGVSMTQSVKALMERALGGLEEEGEPRAGRPLDATATTVGRSFRGSIGSSVEPDEGEALPWEGTALRHLPDLPLPAGFEAFGDLNVSVPPPTVAEGASHPGSDVDVAEDGLPAVPTMTPHQSSIRFRKPPAARGAEDPEPGGFPRVTPSGYAGSNPEALSLQPAAGKSYRHLPGRKSNPAGHAPQGSPPTSPDSEVLPAAVWDAPSPEGTTPTNPPRRPALPQPPGPAPWGTLAPPDASRAPPPSLISPLARVALTTAQLTSPSSRASPLTPSRPGRRPASPSALRSFRSFTRCVSFDGLALPEGRSNPH